jgi:D-arabinose 1-dehydrogenase-like Zn-dependent alcohol dehydrogenase
MDSKSTGLSASEVRAAAERVVSLEAELETAGEASIGDAALAAARAVLHAWVDTAVAVVASPGVGRVAVIHANGRQSSIASSELPFLLTAPDRSPKKA